MPNSQIQFFQRLRPNVVQLWLCASLGLVRARKDCADESMVFIYAFTATRPDMVFMGLNTLCTLAIK